MTGADTRGAGSLPDGRRDEPPSRRWFVPEVIQISKADCGPAALASIIKGFHIPVSYGRLREACQTDLDGSSIDDIEDVAVLAGLDARQVIVPKQHLLIPEAGAIPGMVVVYEPNGGLHFNVLWRVHGPWVQIMDPVRGRRWIRRSAFLASLFMAVHPMTGELAASHVRSDEFSAPLRVRLDRLGCLTRCRDELRAATERPGWVGLAGLDAATVAVETLVTARALRRGTDAARALRDLVARIEQPEQTWRTVPMRFWSMFPGSPEPDGEPTAIIQGAAVIHVRGVTPANEQATRRPAADLRSVEVEAALTERPFSAARAMVDIVREDGLRHPLLLLFGLLAFVAAGVFEALLFRSLIDLNPSIESVQERLVQVAAVVAFAVFMLASFVVLQRGILRVGRRLEMRIRMALLRKLPRLADRYLSSRLIADMAERAHKVSWLAHITRLTASLVMYALRLVLAVVAIIWLDPASALPAILLAVCSIGIVVAGQPFLAERDLRLRSHIGAMQHHYLDALQGGVTIRAHGGQSAMRAEHEIRITEWARSDRGYLRAMLVISFLQRTVEVALIVWLLLGYIERTANPSGALVLLYWTISLPTFTTVIGNVVREHWLHRSMATRLFEPLGALEDPELSGPSVPAPSVTPSVAPSVVPSVAPSVAPVAPSVDVNGARISLRSVDVIAAGQQILHGIDLEITAGRHVAVVGESGAGKSTLLGLLLGWHRAAAGTVEVDGVPLRGAALQRTREESAWIDPTVQLWNRSLLENLKYGNTRDGTSLEGILDVAELAPIIERLPDGLRSSLGEGGALVSGGEGQRVRLGRALGRDRIRLALLDEPFRGLDRTARATLLARLRARWAHATVLCVTHDLAETTTFDRVLVVHDGRIVEDGAPAELMARNGSRYRRLVEREQQVHRDLWGAAHWRRFRVERGELREDRRIARLASVASDEAQR